jgi:hypothetical protein
VEKREDADDVEEFLESIDTASVLEDLLVDASYGFGKEVFICIHMCMYICLYIYVYIFIYVYLYVYV